MTGREIWRDYGNNTSYSADSSVDWRPTHLAVQLGLGLLSQRWLGAGVVNYNHIGFVRPGLSNHIYTGGRFNEEIYFTDGISEFESMGM